MKIIVAIEIDTADGDEPGADRVTDQIYNRVARRELFGETWTIRSIRPVEPRA